MSTNTTTLFGIKNCDTVKKARRWLEDANIDYQFHDVREDDLSKNQVQTWVDALGWESVLNKRSTTWKQLSDDDKNTIDESKAISLMLEHPTLIKRPVLEHGEDKQISNGFKAAQYESMFQS